MKVDAALGVISSDPLIRKGMSDFAERFDFRLEQSFAPEALESNSAIDQSIVDCWFVDESALEAPSRALEEFLEASESPVIYGLRPFSGDPQVLQRECYALLKKLIQIIHQEWKSSEPDIWVLGASLGGPEAVKAFIDKLPKEIPVCFLYAQHLDEVGSKALADVIGRDAQLKVEAIEGLTLLEAGTVYKIPVESSVDFIAGTCFKTGVPWSGSYRPSIEELLRKVSFAFGRRANVIYFSGMGEDGALIANELFRRGSRIWAQSVQTCGSSAMPESVISQRICERIASPGDLAMLLKTLYQAMPETHLH